MAELDPTAVETMIADNGLNEVTLKVCMHTFSLRRDPRRAMQGVTQPVSNCFETTEWLVCNNFSLPEKQ